MNKVRIIAGILVIFGLLVAYFVYSTEKNADESNFAFSYGLDLDGGTRLVYRADVSEIEPAQISDAMDTLRRTIERRVNLFGVSEPIVTVESGSIFGSEENEHRLSVELPGVTDVAAAIAAIGETPLLEFRIETDTTQNSLQFAEMLIVEALGTTSTSSIQAANVAIYGSYEGTGLTGSQLSRASIGFGQTIGASPHVVISFNREGADLFQKITQENIGRALAIFLDGELISAPVIQTEIFGGEASITGQFTLEEVRSLVQNLNFGALPLPIDLIETNTVGPSLGAVTLQKGVVALLIAFALIFTFLVAWYRLPGLLAVVALLMYTAIMLAIFKLIPVTLTASGLAGFILSLGMAVDANILIFERIKEELQKGRSLPDAVRDGFARAWAAIRDGNITSIIAAVILFWMSGTSLVKGFALVFGLGVLISMLTAVAVSRTLLLAFTQEKASKYLILFGSGITGNKK